MMRMQGTVLTGLALVMGQPVIALAGLALGLQLVMGGYGTVRPSLIIAAVSAMAVCLFLSCLKRDVRRPLETRMLIIAVTMPILAWSLPTLDVLFFLMCLWVPVVAGRFNQIVPVYLYSLLLLPGLDKLLSLGPIALFQFNVHNALTLGAALYIFRSAGKAKCRVEWDAVALSIVVLLALAAARDGSASHILRILVKGMLDLGLPYYILSRGLRDAGELRAAMLWLAAGGITVAAIMYFEMLKGWPLYGALYDLYEVNTTILIKSRGGMLRAGGPFVESTTGAMLLSLCILALYCSADSFRNRNYYYIALFLALIGLIPPQSRGAWVGLACAVAITDWLRGRIGQLTAKISILGSLLFALFLVAHFSPFLSAFLGVSGDGAETNDYRRLLFERGLEEFLKNPLTGYSTSELSFRLADLRQGEGIIDFVNAYIWIMLISGIGGIIIFVNSYLYFLNKIARTGRLRERGRRDAEAGAFAFAAIAMWMEMLFFQSFAARPANFLFVLFGFAAAFIRLRQPARLPGDVIGPLNGPACPPRDVFQP